MKTGWVENSKVRLNLKKKYGWVENSKGWLNPGKNYQHDMSWKSEVVVLREMTRDRKLTWKISKEKLENELEEFY